MNACRLDERGTATIWLLLFLPVLFISAAFLANETVAVTSSDVDLTRALESACKAAAMQVTADSQAAGAPRIGAYQALNAFLDAFAENLGLDRATLSPTAGSVLKKPPSFYFLVYNGDDTYSASGAPACRLYTYSETEGLQEYSVAASGFPQTFTVTWGAITPGSGQGIRVQLETPGVIAVADTEAGALLAEEPLRPVRWAAARVVWRNNG